MSISDPGLAGAVERVMEARSRAAFESARDELTRRGGEAVLALIDVLREEDKSRARLACHCLGYSEEHESEAVEALVDATSRPGLVSSAVSAIARFRERRGAQLEELAGRGDPVGIASLASLRLGFYRETSRLLTVAIQALTEKSPWQRAYQAMLLVVDLGPSGAHAAQPVRAYLRSDRAVLRRTALYALASMGAHDRETLSEMLRIRDHGTPEERVCASHALLRLGEHVQSSTAHLVAAVSDLPAGRVKDLAALALADPKAYAPAHRDALNSVLDELGEKTQATVVRWLGNAVE